MTAPQVQQRIQELEQEVAAVRERERRAQQERSAAADLEKAKVLLAHVLNTYPGTAAAARAQQALAALQPQPVLGEGGYPSQVPVDSPPLPAKPSTR
jgi:DNA mismatch repair protein MutH